MATDPAISQLQRDVQELSKSMRDLVTASSRTISAQVAHQKIILDQKDAQESFTKTLKQSKRPSEEENSIRTKAVKLYKAEQEALQRYVRAMDQLRSAENKRNAKEQELATARENATRALQRYNEAQKQTQVVVEENNKVVERSTSVFSKLFGTSTLLETALVAFGNAAKRQALQLRDQVAESEGLVEGTGSLLGALTKQQTLALKYGGMTGKEFAAITNQSRQMLNAMGGTEKGLKRLDATYNEFSVLTGGDFKKALVLATEGAKYFAYSGIKPTNELMKQYSGDLDRMRRLTGMSIEQTQKLYSEVANDVDSIDLLRAARAEERQAILASQRALVNQAIAAGMSAEQAKEAAKMLNRMVAAKPIDRVKQAAKLRVLGGALGVAGGDEAAQAIIAGKRATSEQRAALAQFNQNAANTVDSMASRGLASEIFSSSLLEKLDLESVLGKGSAFSTSLGDSLKPTLDLSTQYIKASDDKLAQVLVKMGDWSNTLMAIARGDHWLGPILTGMGVIAATILSTSLVGKAGGALKGLLKPFGGAKVAGTVGDVAETAGTAAKGGSKLGSIAKTVGKLAKPLPLVGTAIDVGMGLYDMAQGNEQTKMEGLDYISPVSWLRYGAYKSKGLYDDNFAYGGANPLPNAPKPQLPSPLPSTSDDMVKPIPPQYTASNTQPSSIDPLTGQSTNTQREIVMMRQQSEDSSRTSREQLGELTFMTSEQNKMMERQNALLELIARKNSQPSSQPSAKSDQKFGISYQTVN